MTVKFKTLEDFSCSRMAGLQSLCLTATGSAMEICFGDLRSRFGWVVHADRGCSDYLIVGEVSQSISFTVLCAFLLYLKIRFYLWFCIFIVRSFHMFLSSFYWKLLCGVSHENQPLG